MLEQSKQRDEVVISTDRVEGKGEVAELVRCEGAEQPLHINTWTHPTSPPSPSPSLSHFLSLSSLALTLSSTFISFSFSPPPRCPLSPCLSLPFSVPPSVLIPFYTQGGSWVRACACVRACLSLLKDFGTWGFTWPMMVYTSTQSIRITLWVSSVCKCAYKQDTRLLLRAYVRSVVGGSSKLLSC